MCRISGAASGRLAVTAAPAAKSNLLLAPQYGEQEQEEDLDELVALLFGAQGQDIGPDMDLDCAKMESEPLDASASSPFADTDSDDLQSESDRSQEPMSLQMERGVSLGGFSAWSMPPDFDKAELEEEEDVSSAALGTWIPLLPARAALPAPSSFQEQQDLPASPASRKRKRAGEAVNHLVAPAEPTGKRSRKLERFFWTDELHADFLEAIFRLGLAQDKPEQLAELLDISAPESCAEPRMSSKTLREHIDAVRGKEEALVRVFRSNIAVAVSDAPNCTNINQKKGGQPSFHVYPLPLGGRLDLGEFEKLGASLDVSEPTYTHRLMAGIFDLGLMFARPKTVFNLMQPGPPKMTNGSVKSHLQKYRANCRPTHRQFVHQFGPSRGTRQAIDGLEMLRTTA